MTPIHQNDSKSCRYMGSRRRGTDCDLKSTTSQIGSSASLQLPRRRNLGTRSRNRPCSFHPDLSGGDLSTARKQVAAYLVDTDLFNSLINIVKNVLHPHREKSPP
ncbi:hypothetical protein BDN70DRAFT_550794 [Pholiota conissans]|uniref:Uncharacterized protein n=1 Tax=Pholiota conissans TaxID=109636 RepID=A0A9P5YMQ8_9AGAR|nr:hypothetical protein BDN70DRAFT_550794 [Pholiota conissans]